MTKSPHPVNPVITRSWRRPSGNCSFERRYFGADEIRRQIEVLDSRTPALGAKVVARAWTDPAFKERLLANGRAACEELGISFYDDTQLIVLENTETVHNLIVCTLYAPATRGRCSVCRRTGTS
jgi:Nitrile hydratase, alpha chain